jgi:hypothetical protein
MAKPTELPYWDTNESNIDDPGASRKADGWVLDGFGIPEKPSVEHFNHWQNNVFKWIDYIENKYFPDNTEKLLLNENGISGDFAYIGRNYNGGQYYGYQASGDQYYGHEASGDQYYGREAIGDQYYGHEASGDQY